MAQNNPVGTHVVTDGAVGTRVFVGNTTPSYPTTGDLWIDNTAGSMATAQLTTFTATGGETSVTAPYTAGYEMVFLNGAKLIRGTDYTATNGTSITGLTALAASDVVDVFGMTTGSSGLQGLQGTTGTQGTQGVQGIQGTQGLQGLQGTTGTGTQGTIGATGPGWTASAISANTNLVTRYQYFVTTSSTLTLTLPSSPTQGDEIRIFDASGSAATNNITVSPGSLNFQGSVQNFLINVNYGSATLIYTGSTYGWKVA
jgi:hypothetical protein